MTELRPLEELMETIPQNGTIEWIGVRPGRDEEMIAMNEAEIDLEEGLVGDRFSGGAGSKRQITLIQKEHLDVVGSIMKRDSVDPGLLRRNIVVSGINLLSLKDKQFRIGDALLEYTGPCQPCSKMERQLGEGGYNAMRGHGGITARVIEPGTIRVSDSVTFEQNQN